MDGVDEVVHPNQLVEVAGRVDAVISTLPGTDATAGLAGRPTSSRKARRHVVNVGRGTVIDEPALIDALHTGQVGFAALDVFATEPLPSDSPCGRCPTC